KRREAGESGAKSQVTKDTEWRKIMEQLQIEQPVEQSASDSSCQLSAVSSQLLVPYAWGVENAAFSLPRLQRFFQFHAAGRFQQYDIVFASLAREPLAGFFRRRDEFRQQARFGSRFHHRLRQAPHAEQEVKFTSCATSRHVPSALAMHLLAGGPKFQHFAGNCNAPPGGHGSQSVDGGHKRL